MAIVLGKQSLSMTMHAQSPDHVSIMRQSWLAHTDMSGEQAEEVEDTSGS